MKKITVLFFTMIFVCMLLCNSYAASGVSVNAKYNMDESITVNGSAYGKVMFTLAKRVDSGGEASLLQYGEDNPPPFVKQVFVYGDYNFVFLLPSGLASGIYEVHISSTDGRGYASFSYVNVDDAKKACEALSKESDFKKYAELCETSAADIGIDTTDANHIKNKDKIYALMFEFCRDCTEPSDFSNEYAKMYSLCLLNSEADTENVLKNNALNLGIDFSEDYTNDNRVASDAKVDLLAKLKSTDYAEEFRKQKNTSFTEYLEKAKATVSVANAVDMWDLKTCISEEYPSLSTLTNAGAYRGLNDKNQVFSYMMEYTYNDYEDIKTAFDACVKKVADDETPSGGGDSVGSSRPGTSAPSITSPSVVPETSPYEYKMNYTDFTDSHWAYEPVKYLAEKGIISGYTDNSFKPENNITRAEYVKLIVMCLKECGIELSSDKAIEFDDVNVDAWYYNNVILAAQNGIVNGGNGLFRPDDYITREDASVILHRAITNKYTVDGFKIFADHSDISSYARDAVAALAEANIISGMGDNSFVPKGNLTRAQASKLLYNMINYNIGGGTGYEN